MGQTGLNVAFRFIPGQVFPIGPRTGCKPHHPLDLVLAIERRVEPQFVANQPSTKVGRNVVQVAERLRVGEPLRPQLVSQVAALKTRCLSLGEIGTVKLIGS